MKKALVPGLLATLLCAGCTTSSVTNLTPGRQGRNDNHLYNFQVEWHSNQQSLRKESLTPFVVIGMDTYPMQPTPMMPNRWEAHIPIPPTNAIVNYRYKFEYEYFSVPARRKDSRLSPPYQLEIQGR